MKLQILKAIRQELRKIEAQHPSMNDKSHEARVALEFYEYLTSAHSYIHHEIVKERFNVQCATFALDKWSEISNEADELKDIESDHSMEPEGLVVWVDGEKKYFPCFTGEDCRLMGFHDWHKQVKL